MQPVARGQPVMKGMAARVKLEPGGQEFPAEANDTSLEAALRAGLSVPYGCSNGSWGDCRARLVQGRIGKTRPHDYVLSEVEKAQGVFLPCCHAPVTDVVIEASIVGSADIPLHQMTVRVRAFEKPVEDLLILHLVTPRSQRLRFLAGQDVTLSMNGMSGTWPLASCPCDDRHLEIHVHRSSGDLAKRLHDEVRKDLMLDLSGPSGQFVLDAESTRPAVFVAWDEGFSPIKSLLQQAQSQDQAESLTLFWISERLPHYQDNLCRAWADALENFSFHPFASSDGEEKLLHDIAQAVNPASSDLYVAAPDRFAAALESMGPWPLRVRSGML